MWLLVLLSAVGALFWYTDWIYQLPTPVPANYKPVKNGTVIPVSKYVAVPSDKPVLLHFFNPACPCSRFNKTHFQALVREFSDRVTFAVVVMSPKPYSAEEIREKLGLALPVLFDPSIAKACGVYSTPQAVLLDTRHQLYYRGNYNKSRYCTDEKTSYAKMALAGLLRNESGPAFDPYALTSYGCSLPYCKNDSSFPEK